MASTYGRELTRYGQGIGADEFQNYANRMAGIAGMGQRATVTTATLGANNAANAANSGISNYLLYDKLGRGGTNSLYDPGYGY